MTDTIVYAYTGAGWSDYPGRQYMLTRALARHCRVVFLELGGHTDRRRVRPWHSEPEPGITVIHNAMRLRFSRMGKIAPALAASIDGAWIRSVLRQIGVREYVYWVSANDPRLVPGMDTSRLVYDCIDPCFDPASQSAFDRSEREMASAAKLILATAETLVERMRAWHSDVRLLPNGAPDHPIEPSTVSVPARLAGVDGPVVGFMGTIDWRFDSSAVRSLAEGCPDVTVCLVGRVNQEQSEAVSGLQRLPNVVVTGPVSSMEGDAYMARFDVGFIPFTPSAMNDAINPCKLYMHLATGVPVVSTSIRECSRHEPWVIAASGTRSLVQCVRQALAEESHLRDGRRRFASVNRWSDRAMEAYNILQSVGLLEADRESGKARTI